MGVDVCSLCVVCVYMCVFRCVLKFLKNQKIQIFQKEIQKFQILRNFKKNSKFEKITNFRKFQKITNFKKLQKFRNFKETKFFPKEWKRI
jgi:ribosomal protein S21